MAPIVNASCKNQPYLTAVVYGRQLPIHYASHSIVTEGRLPDLLKKIDMLCTKVEIIWLKGNAPAVFPIKHVHGFVELCFVEVMSVWVDLSDAFTHIL